jgi:hypothetical protein
MKAFATLGFLFCVCVSVCLCMCVFFCVLPFTDYAPTSGPAPRKLSFNSSGWKSHRKHRNLVQTLDMMRTLVVINLFFVKKWR